MRAFLTPRKRRWNLEEFIDVVNLKTNQHIGHVLDINARGIGIFSKNPLEFARPLKLRLVRQVPDHSEGHYQFIDIVALGRWQKTRKIGKFYHAGLRYKVADAKSKIRLIHFLRDLRNSQAES